MNAIILLGAPGSGKGTEAKLLAGRLGVPHVSTGEMLRERLRQGIGVGTAVSGAMLAGALVADGVVNRLVEERLGEPDAARGFILDGYPRTVAQAESLREWLRVRGVSEVVIHLVIDYNIVIARLTNRRQCLRCGTVYNLISKPPSRDELCDLDGEKLAMREDDAEPVIRERLEAYERQTSPVLAWYREAGTRVLDVDGDGSPEAVFVRICQAMGVG